MKLLAIAVAVVAMRVAASQATPDPMSGSSGIFQAACNQVCDQNCWCYYTRIDCMTECTAKRAPDLSKLGCHSKFHC
ncbi:BQ5605_C005g03413 [Microbotryum silenes-dioicae]|uniref:BQ5605_C005g03413 protein n=1 Tax=Microbotryum silenes-dioicae TaxID=796604 RepID=A0A2X0P6B8_9BASI|nr:BQ5605_C005g03413 [Microbotryum silenes-dioicae]